MSTILLVESEAFSIALSEPLAKAGFHVQCEHDGRRAIRVAAGCEFDAAIIDAGPPDVSAHRVARGLRARDPELPIFVCTTYDEDTIAQWAIEDRMFVLEKPIDEAQLVWLLHAQIGTLGSGHRLRHMIPSTATEDEAGRPAHEETLPFALGRAGRRSR